MKKIFAVLAVAATFTACNNADSSKTEGAPDSAAIKAKEDSIAAEKAKAADTSSLKTVADTAASKMGAVADTAAKALDKMGKKAEEKMDKMEKKVEEKMDKMKEAVKH